MAENQRRTLQVVEGQARTQGRGTGVRRRSGPGPSWVSRRPAIPSIESQIAAAQYRIGVLVARSPAQVATELADAPRTALRCPATIPVTSPTRSSASAPTWSAQSGGWRRKRPSSAQHRRLSASTQHTGGARASQSGDLDTFGGTGTTRYAVGPVISWPALNLGRVKARVDASRALGGRGHSAVPADGTPRHGGSRGVARGIRKGPDAASRDCKTPPRPANARPTTPGSGSKGGVADFLDVLDAERTMLDAQNQLAERPHRRYDGVRALSTRRWGDLPLGEAAQ
jgi:hypothetical protein